MRVNNALAEDSGSFETVQRSGDFQIKQFKSF